MKVVGCNKYVHIDYISQLSNEEREVLLDAEDLLIEINPNAFKRFNIVKVNAKDKTVTFIECPTFDSYREPLVGDAHKIILVDNINKSGEVFVTSSPSRGILMGVYKITKAKIKNPQIYHHKWAFVDEDYKGFNVKESKEWSKKWELIIPNTTAIKSRIGYRNFWETILKEYNL